MSKKVRVTNDLISKLELAFKQGDPSLSRAELRALERAGYVERKEERANTGTVRYKYYLTPNI